METAVFTFVILNLLFGAVFFLFARLVLGRGGSPLLWSYVIVTVIFVYWLPYQEYSLDVTTDILLLSNFLMFVYLAIVLLVARSYTGRVQDLIASATAVPPRVLAVAIVGWLAWRLYLIVAYGPAALMFSRAQVVYSEGLVEFSSWEVFLSSITTILLLGGLAVLVIRQAAGRRSPLLMNAAALAMLVVILVTNESPIGSRRLLLALAAIWLSVAWVCSGVSMLSWIRKHFQRMLLALMLIAGLSIYYQNVRNNDFADILKASAPADLIAATYKFATTFNIHDTDEIRYLRSGPFDFFAKVVDVSIIEGKSTNGEATAFSLALAVPKALYPGDKPVGDVDEVLLEHLAIYPSQPVINIDYSTSLPTIGMADFGPLGIIAAAIVLSLCFAVIGQMNLRVRRSPFSSLLIFGLSIQMIGSQEAGLTAIVSAFRDVGLSLFILAVGRSLLTFFRRASAGLRRPWIRKPTPILE